MSEVSQGAWLRWLWRGAVLGLLVIPLVLWLLVPALPAILESPEFFCWLGMETKAKQPLLLREQANVREVLAGSERDLLSKNEPVQCYDGTIQALLEDVTRRSAIENVARGHRAGFHWLSLTFDDLGSPTTTYVYRCGQEGAEPLFALGPFGVPAFGLRALTIAFVVWLALWSGVHLVRRHIQTRRDRLPRAVVANRSAPVAVAKGDGQDND